MKIKIVITIMLLCVALSMGCMGKPAIETPAHELIEENEVKNIKIEEINEIIEPELPRLIGSTGMFSIVDTDYPGDWDKKEIIAFDGEARATFVKSNDYRIKINIFDKRTQQEAIYAVSNYSMNNTWKMTNVNDYISWEQLNDKGFELSDVNNWELVEVENTIKGTYTVNDVVMGDLIIYPYDRYLIIAYTLHKNDNDVNTQELLDSLMI